MGKVKIDPPQGKKRNAPIIPKRKKLIQFRIPSGKCREKNNKKRIIPGKTAKKTPITIPGAGKKHPESLGNETESRAKQGKEEKRNPIQPAERKRKRALFRFCEGKKATTL